MERLELDLTFSRDYFTRHFGIQFECDYFFDVRTRVETDMVVSRALHGRFGDLGLGDPDPRPIARLGFDDTLNTVLMFGGELRVSGGVSWVVPGFLSDESLDCLSPPVVQSTWPHTLFLDQFEQAVALYGRGCVLPPVPHGILESAMELRGAAFLEDLMLRPARAERLLDVLSESVIAIKEFWDVQCFGEVRPGLSLGGCSTTMLSADQVSRFLVPRYSRIAERFGDAFICCCGVGTHNLENFARVDGVRYVRLGWGTDLSRAALVLNAKHIKAGLDVVRMASLPPAEVRADVMKVLHALDTVDCVSVLLIHASANTPDANVRAIVEAVRSFADAHNVLFG